MMPAGNQIEIPDPGIVYNNSVNAAASRQATYKQTAMPSEVLENTPSATNAPLCPDYTSVMIYAGLFVGGNFILHI